MLKFIKKDERFQPEPNTKYAVVPVEALNILLAYYADSAEELENEEELFTAPSEFDQAINQLREPMTIDSLTVQEMQEVIAYTSVDDVRFFLESRSEDGEFSEELAEELAQAMVHMRDRFDDEFKHLLNLEYEERMDE